MLKQIVKCPKLWFPYTKKYLKQLHRYCSFSYRNHFTSNKSNAYVNESTLVNWPENYILISERISEIVTKLDTNEKKCIISEANRILQNEIPILKKWYTDTYDYTNKHYKWNIDFSTGNKYPSCFGRFVRLQPHLKGSEIKVPWEFSRLQYLFCVGVAWRLTNNDRYALKIIDMLTDWIQCNPVDQGVNWNIAMEAGIRAVNIILCSELIDNFTGFTNENRRQIVNLLKTHLDYIIDNLENIDYVNNHYIGDILGLLAISASCSFFEKSERIYKKIVKEFYKECHIQILDDGSCSEGTTAYHRLDTEMFAIAAMIIKRTSNVLDESYKMQLTKMSKYAESITDPIGRILTIGDNDSGRIISLLNSSFESNEFASSLASYLGTGKYDRYSLETLLLTGVTCNINTKKLCKHNNQCIYFNCLNQIIIRNNDLYFSFYNIDARKYSVGSHSHNDRLAFVFFYKNTPIFIDPGSGCYTSYPEINQILRSCQSHSTIQIEDFEQNIYTIDVNKEGNVKSNPINYELSDNKFMISSSINYFKTLNASIKRTICLSNGELRINDKLTRIENKRIYIRFVLHPNIVVEYVTPQKVVLHAGTQSFIFTCETDIKQKVGYYSETYGSWNNTTILFIEMENVLTHNAHLIIQ